MRKLAAGIYRDDSDGGTIHFHAREMCQALGIPYTSEACRMIQEEAMRAFVQVFGAAPDNVLIVEVPRQEEVN